MQRSLSVQSLFMYQCTFVCQTDYISFFRLTHTEKIVFFIWDWLVHKIGTDDHTFLIFRSMGFSISGVQLNCILYHYHTKVPNSSKQGQAFTFQLLETINQIELLHCSKCPHIHRKSYRKICPNRTISPIFLTFEINYEFYNKRLEIGFDSEDYFIFLSICVVILQF